MIASSRECIVNRPAFVTLPPSPEWPPMEMLERARAFDAELQRRRSVREFDTRPVPREIIESCLHAAGSAPSGAHQQPWHFVAVSDPSVKAQIRAAAEAEERDFYAHRAPPDWLAALQPLGTDANKPFLEDAPWLIGIFLKRFGRRADGTKVKHYYTDESVGVATGFLIAALHHCGLSTLTHTPSPMGFLNEILNRPKDTERPFLLLVVGYPKPGVQVPNLVRQSLDEFTSFV
jgi:iodotyrosine deiodinase